VSRPGASGSAHSRFPIEPWRLRELGLGDFDQLAQAESLFALSNGHIGVRGNLDEGDPHALPGTYLNSFYEQRPLPYAEAGYGDPESSQTVLNVTNGKLIRLLVGDEPFDMRYGEVCHHERILDLRAGTLHRVVEWCSPAGRRVRLRSTRLVSLTQRSLLAIRYEVEAVDEPVRIVVQSELVTNEPLPPQSADPRVSAVIEHALEPVEHIGSGTHAMLMHRTIASKLNLAVAMQHDVDATWRQSDDITVDPDNARLTVSAALEPGERAALTKYVAYGWSGTRTPRALHDQVDAALTSARDAGWEQVLAEQRTALDVFWAGADVQVDGQPAIQQAVRFSLFHTFQAAARAEQRAIPAKGLTGPGYSGHAFWDTESFVLPVLVATDPHAAADAVKWRHSILGLARERARTLDLGGAVFPWRTINGEECSGYWPAGSAAVHVNADIALAAVRYVEWSGDSDFERDYALPILVETARLWSSLGYHGDDGLYHIDGVTGPDEYSAIGDDNIFTNLSAARNLAAAARAVQRWPDESAALQVGVDEPASWAAAAKVMAIAFDDMHGVHEQSRGYTRHAVWDFATSQARGDYPLLLHAPYSALYRSQVVKQADLMLALHWFGDNFSAQEKAKDFAYYEPLTVRDSSLSACTQAVVAAEVGQLELAADYMAESALLDLQDLEHNTSDGLHIAALAGTWLAIVHGFGGLRDTGGGLQFTPQLPPGWSRLAFCIRRLGARISVEIGADEVSYELLDASVSQQISHAGEVLTLEPDRRVTRPTCRIAPSTPRPQQPPGRAPADAATLTHLRDGSSA
jgi:alpha,alpha-trehalose phosphorylase